MTAAALAVLFALAEPAVPATPAKEPPVASVLSVEGDVRADGVAVLAFQPLRETSRLALGKGARVRLLSKGARVELRGPAEATLAELVAEARRRDVATGPTVGSSLEAAVRSLSDWLFGEAQAGGVAALRGQSAIGSVEVPVLPASSLVATTLLTGPLRARVSETGSERRLELRSAAGRKPVRAAGTHVDVSPRLLQRGPVELVVTPADVTLATWRPLGHGEESALKADLAQLADLSGDLDAETSRLLRGALLARHGALAQADAETEPQEGSRSRVLPWRHLALRVSAAWRAAEGEAFRPLGRGDALPSGSQLRFDVTVSRPAHVILVAASGDTWTVLHEKAPEELQGWNGLWTIELDDVPGREVAWCVASAAPFPREDEGRVSPAALEEFIKDLDAFVLQEGALLSHGFGRAAVRFELEHVASVGEGT